MVKQSTVRRFRTRGRGKVDRIEGLRPARRASRLLQGLAEARSFEEAFEVAVRLGIDPKKTDQLVRGSVSAAEGHGQDGQASRCSRKAREGRARPRKPAPTSWVRKDLADKIEGAASPTST